MKNLLPKDKGDVESVERLKKFTFSELEPSIPELLTWLQDYNWPVAKPMAELLEPHTENLSPHLLKILRGTDGIWKYWILSIFFEDTNRPIEQELFAEITRIADSPTKMEIDDEVDLIAKEIISDHKF